MFELGFEGYSKLSASERETLSEKLGVVGGGVVGLGAVRAVIEVTGTRGVSAAGITSSLARMGRIVGAGMVRGVAVMATIPLLAGVVGYGLIKGFKSVVSEVQLNSTDIDDRWEIMRTDGLESGQ